MVEEKPMAHLEGEGVYPQIIIAGQNSQQLSVFVFFFFQIVCIPCTHMVLSSSILLVEVGIEGKCSILF